MNNRTKTQEISIDEDDIPVGGSSLIGIADQGVTKPATGNQAKRRRISNLDGSGGAYVDQSESRTGRKKKSQGSHSHLSFYTKTSRPPKSQLKSSSAGDTENADDDEYDSEEDVDEDEEESEDEGETTVMGDESGTEATKSLLAKTLIETLPTQVFSEEYKAY